MANGVATERSVDWASLRSAADRAATHAHAPYSGLRVGAAGLAEDGEVVTGCNVENASFGLTLCAECGLVSSLVAGGHGRLRAVSVTAGDGQPLAPCGRCRQVLLEHGGGAILIDAGEGHDPVTLAAMLPGAFDAAELDSRRAT
jgi:cytidine deaminase